MRPFNIGREISFFGLLCLGVVWGCIINSNPSPFKTVLAPKKAKVAIVIDDFGGYAPGIKQMMTIPYPLTFAVLPFAEFARVQATEAQARGFEVIIHFPFQAFNADPRWYGKKYISISSSAKEIESLIEEAFKILPMATGLNNHMGSQATADPRVMREVLLCLARLNRFFLDSKTTMHSQSASLAPACRLPFIERDVFLDDFPAPDFMRKQLKKLILHARINGTAVGIGHVGPGGPALAEVLREEIPKYAKEGIMFVYLSELVHARCAHQFNKSSLSGNVIGIDPGHGGIDGGTLCGKTMEKSINLSVGLRLAAQLRRLGAKTVLTREDDRLLSPYASYENYLRYHRPYKRDDLRLRIKKLETAKASMIISIHTNWSPLSCRRGPVVYYQTASPLARKLANIIQENLNKVQPCRKNACPGHFYLLQQAKIPVVLIELGYLSNPQECRLLQSEAYQEKLVSAIIAGMEEALKPVRPSRDPSRSFLRPGLKLRPSPAGIFKDRTKPVSIKRGKE